MQEQLARLQEHLENVKVSTEKENVEVKAKSPTESKLSSTAVVVDEDDEDEDDDEEEVVVGRKSTTTPSTPPTSSSSTITNTRTKPVSSPLSPMERAAHARAAAALAASSSHGVTSSGGDTLVDSLPVPKTVLELERGLAAVAGSDTARVAYLSKHLSGKGKVKALVQSSLSGPVLV